MIRVPLRAAMIVLLSAGAVATTPAVLSAACDVFNFYPYNYVTCCSGNICTQTVWSGSTLVYTKQWTFR